MSIAINGADIDATKTDIVIANAYVIAFLMLPFYFNLVIFTLLIIIFDIFYCCEC